MFNGSSYPFFMMPPPQENKKSRKSSAKEFLSFVKAYEEFQKSKKDEKKEEKKDHPKGLSVIQGTVLMAMLQMMVGPIYLIAVFSAVRYALETVAMISKVSIP